MNQLNQIRLAALVMTSGIALGAMGAHALESTLEGNGHLAEWKTAALYQLIHGLAMLVVAVVAKQSRPPFCFFCWLLGVLLFSGSLYLLSYTGSTAKPIVLSTPLGGLAFLIGWIALLVKPSQIFLQK